MTNEELAIAKICAALLEQTRSSAVHFKAMSRVLRESDAPLWFVETVATALEKSNHRRPLLKFEREVFINESRGLRSD